MKTVQVIGAGLAGSEAAYYLAERGIHVKLYEMRPKLMTPAHHTGNFAELVCSNSLRSNTLSNAVGVMKAEMRLLNSLIINTADNHQVPAGGALAVDREGFSEAITKTIKNHPMITVIDQEFTEFNDVPTIIATGPLTSDILLTTLQTLLGESTLYFYDAAAPIIDKESIDLSVCYQKSRYEEDSEGDYLNCAMNETEYNTFYDALIEAECVPIKSFEMKVFEGCMPFETMAKRGKDTLRFGPMKPVGLAKDPSHKPHAVVQLRQDDIRASMYNIVGFQTHLTFSEQKRIVRMIPGLENARIIRYGVMHKNAFINAPKHLNESYQLRSNPKVFIAGQLSGVEGYVESAASGLIAALNMHRLLNEIPMIKLPVESVMGAQADYIANANPKHFQPMNANFGLLPPLEFKHRKNQRKALYASRALEAMEAFIREQ